MGIERDRNRGRKWGKIMGMWLKMGSKESIKGNKVIMLKKKGKINRKVNHKIKIKKLINKKRKVQVKINSYDYEYDYCQ